MPVFGDTIFQSARDPSSNLESCDGAIGLSAENLYMLAEHVPGYQYM